MALVAELRQTLDGEVRFDDGTRALYAAGGLIIGKSYWRRPSQERGGYYPNDGCVPALWRADPLAWRGGPAWPVKFAMSL